MEDVLCVVSRPAALVDVGARGTACYCRCAYLWAVLGGCVLGSCIVACALDSTVQQVFDEGFEFHLGPLKDDRYV